MSKKSYPEAMATLEWQLLLLGTEFDEVISGVQSSGLDGAARAGRLLHQARRAVRRVVRILDVPITRVVTTANRHDCKTP